MEVESPVGDAVDNPTARSKLMDTLFRGSRSGDSRLLGLRDRYSFGLAADGNTSCRGSCHIPKRCGTLAFPVGGYCCEKRKRGWKVMLSCRDPPRVGIESPSREASPGGGFRAVPNVNLGRNCGLPLLLWAVDQPVH